MPARAPAVPTLLLPQIACAIWAGPLPRGRWAPRRSSCTRAAGARRSRREGRGALVLDDLAELATHGLRAAGRAVLRRDPGPARSASGRLRRARRS